MKIKRFLLYSVWVRKIITKKEKTRMSNPNRVTKLKKNYLENRLAELKELRYSLSRVERQIDRDYYEKVIDSADYLIELTDVNAMRLNSFGSDDSRYVYTKKKIKDLVNKIFKEDKRGK